MIGRRAGTVLVAGAMGLIGCDVDTGGHGDDGTKPRTSAVSTSAAGTPSSSLPTPSPSAPVSPSASVSVSVSPSPVPVTGPEQKLVTMTVTGGYAGVNRMVVLRGDGTARVTDEGESTVRRTSAARFLELRTLLGDPALDEVPEFTMHVGAADMFQYTLSFNGRTVMTDRSGDEPALDRLITALSELLPQD